MTDKGFQLLAEKEAMWAEMLMEALQDNGIPCASMPVLGAGFAMKTGLPERLQIYVSTEKMQAAEELMEELFPAEEARD